MNRFPAAAALLMLAFSSVPASAQPKAGDVQPLWWHWITETQAAGTDNARLLRWVLVPQKGR